MGRKLRTYETEDGKGFCEVHFDFKEELAYIKYFDDNGKQYFKEEFPNRTLEDVNKIAENWVFGGNNAVSIN